MRWLGLNPRDIVERMKRSGWQKPPLGFFASVNLGALGLMVVSVAGFTPWAIGGKALHRAVGEVGMYLACAIVFIALSGLVLHRLIFGPGSLARFYQLFAVSFSAYSVCWIVGWMSFRGHLGSVTGLFLGALAMSWLLIQAFDAREQLVKVVAMLFVLNALGYFIGGWVEAGVASIKQMHLLGVALSRRGQMIVAMLLWGVFYGLGFGAGVGVAFYQCQAEIRRLLAENGLDRQKDSKPASNL